MRLGGNIWLAGRLSFKGNHKSGVCGVNILLFLHECATPNPVWIDIDTTLVLVICEGLYACKYYLRTTGLDLVN